jgi:large subunit ribosomal protein L31
MLSPFLFFPFGYNEKVVFAGLSAQIAKVVMKKNIHPKYVESQVTCGCGNKFATRATRPELKVDICNVCHPFYTGKLKFVDTAGRIEKFKKKFASTSYSGEKK